MKSLGKLSLVLMSSFLILSACTKQEEQNTVAQSSTQQETSKTSKKEKEEKLQKEKEEKRKKEEEEKTAEEKRKKEEEEKRKAEEARKAEEERKAEESRQLIASADNAIANLEANQVNENIAPAQEAVDKVTDQGKKAELQGRINDVKGAIEQRAAEEAQRLAEAAEAQRQAEIAEAQQNRTVYVARYGQADVYWYSTSNMPSNTRMDRVVQMTEAEAISQGKRHSSKE